jgi:hypothetical protein
MFNFSGFFTLTLNAMQLPYSMLKEKPIKSCIFLKVYQLTRNQGTALNYGNVVSTSEV